MLVLLIVCRRLSSPHSIGCCGSSSFLSFIYSGLLLQADAQPYYLSPSGVQQVNEGGSFVFDCTVETGMTPVFFVFLDDSTLSILMGSCFNFGPVTTSDSGNLLQYWYCSGHSDLFVVGELCVTYEVYMDMLV